jgi:hypothetical protein
MSDASKRSDQRVAPTTRPLRVAVASIGDPASPNTWSGTTAGVFHALRDLGVEVEGLDMTLPPGLEQALLAGAALSTRNRFDAHGAALTMKIRDLLAGRQARGANLDGVIQMSTNFALPQGIPYVTLEDMTLRQGVEIHPVFSRMSARGVAGWERRRADIYRRARRCTVASHWAANSLIDDYGLQPEQVAVVGFGANHRVDAHDREWGAPRLLFVGVDWERKGGPFVLRAFARLRDAIPRATLDVVGGHPPLQEQGVTAHGMLSPANEHHRETIAALFARATCFVMPSRVEPFGIVYVEAASAGVPSIASSVGGPIDIVGAEGGILVEPADEQGLFEAMLRLADPDTARCMGAAAHARSALYTWSKVAERLLRALGLPAPDGRNLAQYL